MKNTLYFGDNLDILRNQIADESIDLIYLDPPFNSKRDYNLLFKTPKGMESDAQITAFEDSWHWGEQAENEFREIQKQPNTDVAEMMQALRSFLGQNDMMAYLTMMANRLLELHRVLKDTGSLYLHCDPTASHYLKIVLDGVFGKTNYRTEISWKRSSAHNDAKQGRQQYGNIRDIIFFYTKSNKWNWNWLYTIYDEKYINDFYKHIETETGRRYQLDNLTGPGGAGNGNPSYEVMGVTRYWRYTQDKMNALIKEGRIVQTSLGSVPRYKRYLDEMNGVALQNDWSDIQPAQGNESIGYPTQKPLALLERIIAASSNEGDVVLDPFCGCGTAVDAAQNLKRNWIGIDITHLSINLIEERMKKRYPALNEKGAFETLGVPKDFAAASNLALRDKYQFQYWALSLVKAQPFKGGKKGADGGVDGFIFPEVAPGKTEKIIVSVKGGENVGLTMLKDLITTVAHNKAAIGLFVTLTPPTKPMIAEAAAAGHFESPHHGAFARIQILTIEGLLNGTERAKYPDMSYGQQTFKAAKVADKAKKSGDLFNV